LHTQIHTGLPALADNSVSANSAVSMFCNAVIIFFRRCVGFIRYDADGSWAFTERRMRRMACRLQQLLWVDARHDRSSLTGSPPLLALGRVCRAIKVASSSAMQAARVYGRQGLLKGSWSRDIAASAASLPSRPLHVTSSRSYFRTD